MGKKDSFCSRSLSAPPSKRYNSFIACVVVVCFYVVVQRERDKIKKPAVPENNNNISTIPVRLLLDAEKKSGLTTIRVQDLPTQVKLLFYFL